MQKLESDTNPILEDYRGKIFPIKMTDVRPNLAGEWESLMCLLEKEGIAITELEIDFVLTMKKFIRMPGLNSMAPDCDIDQMEYIFEQLVHNKVMGSIVECGSFKGGMCMWMKTLTEILEPHLVRQDKRNIYMFDTFGYFPSPMVDKDRIVHPLTEFIYHGSYYDVESIKKNFKTLGLLDESIHFIKGEFADTMPVTNVGEIALLRIDSDYYGSVMLALDHYYFKIVKGGYIVIDDYYNDVVSCKEAVDDFRKRHTITHLMVDCRPGVVYWQIPPCF